VTTVKKSDQTSGVPIDPSVLLFLYFQDLGAMQVRLYVRLFSQDRHFFTFRLSDGIITSTVESIVLFKA